MTLAIVWRSKRFRGRSPDLLFVDLAGASAQSQITDAGQKAGQTLAFRECRGFDNPPHQSTSGLSFGVFRGASVAGIRNPHTHPVV